MKKFTISLAVLFLAVVLLNSCEKKDEKPPELPPYNSMAIDFSKLSNDTKSTDGINLTDASKLNFALSAITVSYWNFILGVTLAVPVASFYKSFDTEPTYLGNKKWQWGYTVTTIGGNYNARLIGTIGQSDVTWEMYISKSGIGGFEEFLWFEGTSNLDGKSGQWILNESPLEKQAVLQIDWTRTSDVVGNVKYTYIRESDNGIVEQLSNGSYLNYGLAEGDYNAFYTIHYNTRDKEANPFMNVNIEWSTTVYNGRIKAEHYYSNTDWHCWDSLGSDAVCP